LGQSLPQLSDDPEDHLDQFLQDMELADLVRYTREDFGQGGGVQLRTICGHPTHRTGAGDDCRLEPAKETADVFVGWIVVEYLIQQATLVGTVDDGEHTKGTIVHLIEDQVAGETGQCPIQVPRKVLLIADQLSAHQTPEVDAWVEEHRDRLEVFYLPTHAPERNPVEYMNQDLKAEVHKKGLPDDKPTLRSQMGSFMHRLINLPDHVISYFFHPDVQYAAPVEL
jgi:DDE superfamily endonuclease